MGHLRLSHQLGSGANKVAYDIGNGQIALIHKAFLRSNGKSLSVESYESFRLDYEGIKELQKSFSGLTYNEHPVFPLLKQAILDKQGRLIGYISEKIQGKELEIFFPELSPGEQFEAVRQVRDQLYLIYKKGLIHGDAHAGNILVSRDSQNNLVVRLVDFTEPNLLFHTSNDDYAIFYKSMSQFKNFLPSSEAPNQLSSRVWSLHLEGLRNIQALVLPPLVKRNGTLTPKTDNLPQHQLMADWINQLLDRQEAGKTIGPVEMRILHHFTEVARAVAKLSGDSLQEKKLFSSDIDIFTSALLKASSRFGLLENDQLILLSLAGE